MLPRTLEPEVMDTVEEASDYDSMDHSGVNRLFINDMLAAAENLGARWPQTEILDVGTGTALIPIELFSPHVSLNRAICGDIPRDTQRSKTAAPTSPSNLRVRAIDLAAEMLKLAQANVDRAGLSAAISLQLVDAKRLPFEDTSFDWVMSNSIVHHIPEPCHCFAEMLRVLKPGGLLFVRDLVRLETAEDIEVIVRTYAGADSARQQQLFRQSLHAALSLGELRSLMRSFGVTEAAVQQTSDRHWTLATLKPAGR